MSCPNASNVNVVSMPPPSGCTAVEGCPDGEPVIAEVAVATEEHPTYAEGDSVPLSTDLDGQLRTRGGATTASGTMAVLGDTVVVNCRGMGSVRINIITGGNANVMVFSWTARMEGSPIEVQQLKGFQTYGANDSIGSGAAVNGNDQVTELVNVEGFETFEVRLDQVTPGDTATVYLQTCEAGCPIFAPYFVSASGANNYGGQLPVIGIYQEAIGQGTWRGVCSIGTGYDILSAQVDKTMTYAVGAKNAGGLGAGIGFLRMDRVPVIYKSVQANAAGNTALWTPTAGYRFRLMRYMVTVTGNASFAGAAVLTVSLLDGAAATGQDHDTYIPLAAGIIPGTNYNSGWIDLGDQGFLSALFNNILNVNLSAALATGSVRVICCGTEEDF